jgi:hypothetical protein
VNRTVGRLAICTLSNVQDKLLELPVGFVKTSQANGLARSDETASEDKVAMVSLSWRQVNAWRLSQHSLLQRADRKQLLQIVKRIGGVHAQLMSAAKLTLWARVENLSPTDVENALWRDRTLIKTWAMRGTLHLLAASDFPLYVAARSAISIRRPPSYYKYHGVTPAEYDAILESIPQTLGDAPMTREQLADAVAKQARKPKLREVLLSGWGALLKPSAFRGDLCFGPSQGHTPRVTFVRPSQWVGDWTPVEPQEALKEIARRYLTTYGPATADDFARWWGFDASQAKKVFRALGDELEAVEVEGWKAWALASTLKPLKALKASRSVRLLPQFDAYTVGVSRNLEPILPQAHKSRIHRPQGWISAVVLVNGRMEGIWEYDNQGSKIAIKIEMFAPPPASVKRSIQAEAKRLGDYFGAKAELVYI